MTTWIILALIGLVAGAIFISIMYTGYRDARKDRRPLYDIRKLNRKTTYRTGRKSRRHAKNQPA